MPPDLPTPDRPGTPESEKAFDEWWWPAGIDYDDVRGTAAKAWHAAVAWASRVERERAAKKCEGMAMAKPMKKNFTNIFNAGVASCVAAIRSDPDAPEEADRGQ